VRPEGFIKFDVEHPDEQLEGYGGCRENSLRQGCAKQNVILKVKNAWYGLHCVQSSICLKVTTLVHQFIQIRLYRQYVTAVWVDTGGSSTVQYTFTHSTQNNTTQNIQNGTYLTTRIHKITKEHDKNTTVTLRNITIQGKAFPLQPYGPRRFWEVKASRFRDIGT
jgi:hypothetical protein